MQVVSHHSLLPPAASTQVRSALLQSQKVEQLTPGKADEAPSGIWETGKFSFGDFIDMINPLQHLPVISTIYRKLTGDEMGDAPRMIGGAVFGAVLGSWVSGLASAVANVFVSHSTGKDIGGHVLDVVASSALPSKQAGKPLISQSQAYAPTPSAHLSPPGELAEGVVAAERAALSTPVRTVHDHSTLQQVSVISRAVDSMSQLEESQVVTAIAHYRQQISIDDIKRDSHYWA